VGISRGFVYVLRCNDQKLYIGSTRNITDRLQAHSMGRVRTTKSRRPVQVVYMEEFATYSEARKRELYFKSGRGRDLLREKLQSGYSP